MKILRGIASLERPFHHTVVCIGNFDGVHEGHRRLISLALEKARARCGVAVAYTFLPHPHVALRPERQSHLLSTYEERLELLARTGLDAVIEEPFVREFSTQEYSSFFNDVILRRLQAEVVVVGYDFAFGNCRHGHLQELEKLCRESGVELGVVQPQRVGEEVVSSSRIRQLLLGGEVEEASRLLGRDFSYRGPVERGDGRGRTIGFPTANLKLGDKLQLPLGVYATMARFGDRDYASVTNLGVRPTFYPTGERAMIPILETHFLDQQLDLYGSTIEVRFRKKIRDERRFSGVEELKTQIALDLAETRRILASGN